jgi:hypothetical protein
MEPMSFLKRLFGNAKLNGATLADSPNMFDYAQIDLLSRFADARPLDSAQTQQRWNRVLPQPYDQTIRLFEEQGWLTHESDEDRVNAYRTSALALPFVESYQERLARARLRARSEVRKAIEERDTGKALEIRRRYESSHPLGSADWSGPKPQLSRSSLTRRILYLQHWLLEGLTPETVEWLKCYAAEQHLWETSWRLEDAEIPEQVANELRTPQMDAVEAAYWRAYGITLLVDNQETWQRCKGGDHVRRIEIVGFDDEFTCSHCKESHGNEYLVARVPELPHRACTSSRGCRCRYEPVLDSYE